MPIYEYCCPDCAQVFEEWVTSAANSETALCPACDVPAARIMSNTTFMLKGGGWYVTEYGNRATTPEKEAKTNDSSGSEASPASPAATETSATAQAAASPAPAATTPAPAARTSKATSSNNNTGPARTSSDKA